MGRMKNKVGLGWKLFLEKKFFSEIQDGRQKMGLAKNYKLNESWNFYFPTKMFISGEKFEIFD